MILAHGFGSGLGFFFKSIDSLLSSGEVSRVLCVDWLGMGGSARPPCRESPIRSVLYSSSSRFSLCNSEFSTANKAVDFFLDPFDEWLHDEARDGEPLWLFGHSLGGYLAAKYVMRIHERSSQMPNIKKCVLASPVGFQPLPKMNERMPTSDLPAAMRLVDALWSSNFTPQSLVRMMGSSRGKSSVKKALRGRIPHLNDQSTDLLSDYLYHITVAPASGEYAMNSLLEPYASAQGAGVFAREHIGEGEIAKAIRQNLHRSPLKSILTCFGDHDWMRSGHEASARAEMESISSMGIRSNFNIVSNAGHHLYLDNEPELTRLILEG